MPHYRNKPEYKRLLEKIRLVEKSGQYNTVHHQNMVKYIQAEKQKTQKPLKVARKQKNEGLKDNGE